MSFHITYYQSNNLSFIFPNIHANYLSYKITFSTDEWSYNFSYIIAKSCSEPRAYWNAFRRTHGAE